MLSKESTVDAVGKNGVTPLHVAVHYDNTALAMLMLERGASPHAAAKNGYTPLHISARKNQLDIARYRLRNRYLKRKRDNRIIELNIKLISLQFNGHTDIFVTTLLTLYLTVC